MSSTNVNPCCCCTVRTASQVIAIYSILLYGFFSVLIGKTFVEVVVLGGGDHSFIVLTRSPPSTQDYENQSGIAFGLMLTTVTLLFVIVCLGLLFSCIFLCGTINNNWAKCKAWLVMEAVFQVIRMLVLACLCLVWLFFGPNISWLLLGTISTIMLNWYLIWVVFSYMAKIKMGDFLTENQGSVYRI